jgi:hypothetical protein
MGTGIAGVLLVFVLGAILAVAWMQIDLHLNAEVEEFIDIFLLSYFPAIIIVSFAYPLFARLGKERPPMLYRWQYWVRFLGGMLLFALVALLVLGWCFSLIAMGLWSSLVVTSVFWGPARDLLDRIVGASASDVPWPPRPDATQDATAKTQYVSFVARSAIAAAAGLFCGVYGLLQVGFAGQNLILMFLGD